MLTPGPRTVTTALRVLGLAMARHFTNDQRVWKRASGSARQGSRMLLGRLLTVFLPPGATIGLGAADTVARRSGRQIRATGCEREAVRSAKNHVSRCVGLHGVARMLVVPGPWSRRVWALPLLTARCWPTEPGQRRRHPTRLAWVRHMMPHVRRWWPGRRLGLVVDGGCAAVSLALAWAQPRVALVSRVRWAAARYHPPGPQPPGQRGRTPLKGTRPRRWQGWAERAETPWETVEVDGDRGERTPRWIVARPARWSTPGLPPVALRDVLVAEPAGKRRLAACCGTDLEATPVPSLPWVVMRWSVEVTCEAARAPLGLETPRPWSDPAIARTTPVLLARFSVVTVLALTLSQAEPIPVPVTAWSHTAEPTFAECLAWGRGHLWRARSVVNAAAQAACVQFPRAAFELWCTGLPLAA
jgi:hypothetical protein